MRFTCFSIKGININKILKMRFILVSTEDPSVKKVIEIPTEIVTNKASIQSEVIKPAKQPTETQQTKRKKSRQTSKSIIYG
tara:strand:+ start:522 stop:764 length:243 start_codon:yes stop_codon:yes gene_type:complete